jgi:Flp pilus assembly protein TadD
MILVGIPLLCAAGAGCQSADKIPKARRNPELAQRESARGLALAEKGKYDEAERALKKAIEADVMFGPARNNLGLVYYHQGKLYQAAWEFQNAVKLMPYLPEPRNNLGLVLERAGRLDDAEVRYREAREREPDNPEYIGNLARAKIRQGQTDEETRELLEELALKDTRQTWQDWAKVNLYRLARPPAEPAAATTQSTPE